MRDARVHKVFRRGKGAYASAEAAVLAAAVAIAGVAPALWACGGARAEQMPRLRGTIAAVAGDELTINLRDGKTARLKLVREARIGTVKKAALSDIKPGDFVGATAIPRKDGQLVALEIHIFPPVQRGAGEGSRPWDLAPGSSMTNGDVSGAVESEDGRKLTLNYRGGQKTVIVTSRTPIVFNTTGARSDLISGIGIVAAPFGRDPDGVYETDHVTVGKNGVNPAD